MVRDLEKMLLFHRKDIRNSEHFVLNVLPIFSRTNCRQGWYEITKNKQTYNHFRIERVCGINSNATLQYYLICTCVEGRYREQFESKHMTNPVVFALTCTEPVILTRYYRHMGNMSQLSRWIRENYCYSIAVLAETQQNNIELGIKGFQC